MNTKSNRAFVSEAKQSWLAWVLARALSGNPPPPDVADWSRLVALAPPAELSRLKGVMEGEIGEVLDMFFGPRRQLTVRQFVERAAALSEEFIQSTVAQRHHTLGRVRAFEERFGKLVLQQERGFDTPAYGEIILQSYSGFTVRYPEYHLAADLCHLHSALAAELDRTSSLRCNVASVNMEFSQTLARTIIVTVYNLLESTVTGLATEWLLSHPGVPNPRLAALRSRPEKNVPLWRRFVGTPGALVGRHIWFDTYAEPLNSLFWHLKRRRDYIVHCAPDARPDDAPPAPALEDEYFHDISMSVVEETMDKAFAAISLIWPHACGRPAPSWLPVKKPNGRYEQPRFQRQSPANP